MDETPFSTKGLLLYAISVLLFVYSAAATSPIPVRLVGGFRANQGIVQVNLTNQWGTICSHNTYYSYNFGVPEATVVCRMLGYYGGGLPHGTIVNPAQYNGRSLMDYVMCYGNETSITECRSHVYDPYGYSSCDPNHHASVSCMSTSDIRLRGGTRDSEGRLEVFYNGKWGTVCLGNNQNAATVVCRMLGYKGDRIVIRQNHYYGPGSGKVWLDLHGFSCTGKEASLGASLFTCSTLTWGVTHCTDLDDDGLDCQPHLEPKVPVRLVNGNYSYEGRVEVLYNGTWGALCTSTWDKPAAQVVCNQLNMTNTLVIPVRGYFANTSGKIWTNKVECTGNERDLGQCQHYPWGHPNCSDVNQAGVMCIPESIQANLIRLQDGQRDSEGRLEMFYQGQWGTVSKIFVTTEAIALVVCRMLGYSGRIAEMRDANKYYGAGNGSIWLGGVRCFGGEKSLFDCQMDPIGYSGYHSGYYSHDYDLGIDCEPLQANLIRLRDGDRDSEGRLEVFYKRQWGTVCVQNFDNKAASVVCRMLGYSGRFAEMRQTIYFGAGNGSIWSGDIGCNGDEKTLFNCTMNQFEDSNCQDHSRDVGIDCEPWKQLYLGIRLVNGTTPREGRVEVQFKATWGTVCDKTWNAEAATVACNQLGFFHVVPVTIPGAFYGAGTGPIFIDGLQCTGSEANLGYCAKSPLGVNNCSHNEDAGLKCLLPDVGLVG